MPLDIYEFLKSLEFTRVSGSPEELKAAAMIRSVIYDMGGIAEIKPFDVNLYEVKEAQLSGDGIDYPVTGIKGSGSVSSIDGQFFYLEYFDNKSNYDVYGKVVLVNGRISKDLYHYLVDHKAVAYITMSGDITDDMSDYDVSYKELREPFMDRGIIPGFCMHVNTAMRLVIDNPKYIHASLNQKIEFGKSQNVIAEIKGTKYPKEVIVVTAHYDSVEYSKGVYDNGSGSAIILKLYEYFYNNLPDRTLRFIWCGSEERGLLGSKAYVENLTDDDLNKIIFNINVDVAGPVLGTDFCTVTGDNDLLHYVTYFAKIIGFQLGTKQDVYSSDSVPFCNKGIQAANFMRFGAPGAAHIHNRHDTMNFLSKESLEKTYSFIELFTKTIVNSVSFPISKGQPDNMVEAIRKYLDR